MARDEDIRGLTELGKLLDQLPAQVQKNVLGTAVKRAADVLLEPMRRAAPVWSGRLEESIVTVRESGRARYRRSRSQTTQMLTSAGVAFRKPGRRYWHLTEFGTVRYPAKPWIRPTFAAKQAEMVRVMREYIGKRIEREARKLDRAANRKLQAWVKRMGG